MRSFFKLAGNIVLDLLQRRESFFEEAQELFTLSDKKQVKLFVSALTIITTHFILFRHLKTEARKVVGKLKVLVEVLPIDDKILELAFASDFKDFEDAVQYYTALENNLDVIITRNKKDFKNSALPVLTAKEYVSGQ